MSEIEQPRELDIPRTARDAIIDVTLHGHEGAPLPAELPREVVAEYAALLVERRRRVEDVKRARELEIGALEGDIAYIWTVAGSALEAAIKAATLVSRKKSAVLGSVTVGSQRTVPRVVDRRAAEAWAAAYRPDLIKSKIVESLDARGLFAEMKRMEATPPGVYPGGDERYYVRGLEDGDRRISRDGSSDAQEDTHE